jgi:hypothetical protein
MLKQKMWGIPPMSGQNCSENFPIVDFKSTITMSIFSRFSIMTTFWKSHGHSASNGIDLVEFWALCQKITSPEARSPSKYAMQP